MIGVAKIRIVYDRGHSFNVFEMLARASEFEKKD